jgi:hypothetical protein
MAKNQKTKKEPLKIDLSSHKIFFKVLEAGGRQMDFPEFKNAVWNEMQKERSKTQQKIKDHFKKK